MNISRTIITLKNEKVRCSTVHQCNRIFPTMSRFTTCDWKGHLVTGERQVNIRRIVDCCGAETAVNVAVLLVS
jgi:hypothetical protein